MALRNRHWKQRFSPDASYVWNKSLLWGGETTKVGDPIPDDLRNNSARLARFWESGVIQVEGFVAPDVITGQIPEAPESGEMAETPETAESPEGNETEQETEEVADKPETEVEGNAADPEDETAIETADGEDPGDLSEDAAETVDWQAMPYADQAALARKIGVLTGRGMPNKEALATMLGAYYGTPILSA